MHEDLSGSAGAPRALRKHSALAHFSPSAYYTAHNDMNQIVYLAESGRLWELYWQGQQAVTGFDLMAHLEAPQPTATPVTYYGAGTNTKHVIYLSGTELHELWWVPGGTDPAHNNLSWVFEMPAAGAEIVGFEVEGSNSQHVAYIGADGRIYELIW